MKVQVLRVRKQPTRRRLTDEELEQAIENGLGWAGVASDAKQ
jgi:hypothetical protein